MTLENTIVADSLKVSVTGDLELSHSITLRSPTGHSASTLIAGGEVSLGDDAVISGTPASVLTISGASIAFAPSSAIRGIDTRITATSGGVALGRIDGGALTVLAPGDIALGSLSAGAAHLTSVRGNIDFGGPVRMSASDLARSSASPLAGSADGQLVARADGTITIAAPMAADGGISLAARSIFTTGTGSIIERTAAGAPIVLRGDTIALTFADPVDGTQPVSLNIAGYTAAAAR